MITFDKLAKKIKTRKYVGPKLFKFILLVVVLGLSASVGIAIFFFGQSTVGTQISSITGELNSQCSAQLKNQETLVEKYRQDLQVQAEQGSYDRIRMGDATNILLALQNYNFDKNGLPEKLGDLAKGDFYSGNLNDPETGNEYFYKKIDAKNYILCFYLSTGIWGTNKSQCPNNEIIEISIE